MKRIAIFIDGTWNRPDAKDPTNVLRLCQSVKHTAADDVQQVSIYTAGVGSGRGSNWLMRKADRLLGGAFGWGLLDIIEDVYRRLIFLYEPGDEIFIFGFSRGAFAARSLAGLIRSCGIPPRRLVHTVPDAMKLYVARGPESKPDDPKSRAFREENAPYTATSASEFNSRRKRGNGEVVRLTIEYIGVWDTVKALGIPEFLQVTDRIKAKYNFHDDALSSSVISARHAVAIDETRKTFPSRIWGNLDILNGLRRGAFLQQYFPGDHGSVGGGGERKGLSSITLHWIAIGAQQAGLDIDWHELDYAAPKFNHLSPLRNKTKAKGMLDAVSTIRPGPSREIELSLAAFDRYMDINESYRPGALEDLKDELFGMDADGQKQLRQLMIDRDGGPTHIAGQHRRPRFEITRKRW